MMFHVGLLALLSTSEAFTTTRRAASPKLLSSRRVGCTAATPSDDCESTLLAAPAQFMAVASTRPKQVVMKFGGSSLADAARLQHVAALVQQQMQDEGTAPVLVCSAMGSTTNALLAAGDFALGGKVYMEAVRATHHKACDELSVAPHTRAEVDELLAECEKLLSGVSFLGELSPRSKDLLVSFGERLACRLVAATLNLLQVPAKAFDAWDLGLQTTSEFGNAEVLPQCYPEIKTKLQAALASGECSAGYPDAQRLTETGGGGGGATVVPVVTGFVAHDASGRVTTLGRGGSDLTAAVLGAAAGFAEIQVWKDVDGMLTADPRVVPTAVPVASVTFEEASELAYFGAKILHPISMQPAMAYNIPVRIKNSYNPSHPGTLICDRCTTRSPDRLVTAITIKKGQSLVDVVSTRMLGQYGFLAKVFNVFERHKLSVDVVATSEVSVSLTLASDRRDLIDLVVAELSATDKSQTSNSDSVQPIAQVNVQEGRSIISLIANVKRSSDVMAAVFEILRREHIQVEMLSQGASKVNISLVVKDCDLKVALEALHQHFFADEVANAGPFVAPPDKDLSHR